MNIILLQTASFVFTPKFDLTIRSFQSEGEFDIFGSMKAVATMERKKKGCRKKRVELMRNNIRCAFNRATLGIKHLNGIRQGIASVFNWYIQRKMICWRKIFRNQLRISRSKFPKKKNNIFKCRIQQQRSILYERTTLPCLVQTYRK